MREIAARQGRLHLWGYDLDGDRKTGPTDFRTASNSAAAPSGGFVRRLTPLEFPHGDSLEVLGAEYGTAWHLHVWDSAEGTTSIVEVTGSGSRIFAGPFDEITSFGPSHGSALLVYPRSSLSWIIQVSADRTQRTTMPVDFTEAQPWHHAIGHIATLASVPLDKGEQLLVVADLGGDKGWFGRLNDALGAANVTELDGPFSLLSTDTIARTLLMARDRESTHWRTGTWGKT